MYGLAGAGGSRARARRNAVSAKSLNWRIFRKGVASMALAQAVREAAPARVRATVVETDVPARLDRLTWNRFHTLVVVALGVTWILDGLEVTLAGAISPALKESPQLRFSNADVGIASSAYLAGAVLGALFFGWLTDRL